jgi:pimeloyl-ACP methyl ester carboxylesterase
VTAVSTSETITLKDGRTLCFARYGASGGKPVIYLHGAGRSRIDGEHYDVEARAAGVEIIATDRPGCGGSSPKPDRTFLSYALDLQELADQLGVARFVVAGMSSGGAYAMAAAVRLRDRVTAAIPINSATPMHDPVARKVSPLTVRWAYRMMSHRWMIQQARRSGERIVNSPDTNERVRLAMLECQRQNESGYIEQEIRLSSSPWGFDHTAIAQPVEIFTGDRDGGFRYAPFWAKALPAGRVHVFSGGHDDYTAPDVIARIVAAMAAAP